MKNNIKKPNFFIIGAPKCGTTSMSRYLRGHSDVFFSKPKELNYFATDFSERGVIDKKNYLKHFEGAAGFKAVGEGTTVYLYSKEAVKNILDFNSEARFIVMVRNPVNAFHSLHFDFYHGAFNENIKNPQRAWKLRKERGKGRYIPEECPRPKLLQYGEVYKLGKQIKRLFSTVSDENKVKIIEFEHFKNETRQVYKETLSFLGVEDDSKERFPTYNSSSKIRFNLLKRLLKKARKSKLKSLSELLKEKLGKEHWSLLINLRKVNKKNVEKTALNENFREELARYFKEDQKLLKKMIDSHEK